MNTYHKEIYKALEKIPNLYKDYIKLESSINGTEMKKKLSIDDYQVAILNFDDRESKGAGLKRKILTVGKLLHNAKPDFKPSYQDKKQLQTYIQTVGEKHISERMKLQVELLELLEVKKQFTTISDFLDEMKVKELNKYLKGKI